MILYRVMHTRSKIQRNKQNKNVQASRGLTPAPSLISEFLEWVNLVPADAEMPDYHEVYSQLTKREIEEYRNWNENTYKNLRSIAPPDHYILMSDEDLPPDYGDQVKKYVLAVLDYIEEGGKRTEAMASDEDWTLKALNYCLSNLPEDFQASVLKAGINEEDGTFDTSFATFHYNLIRNLRENFQILVEATTSEGNLFQKNMILQKIKLNAHLSLDINGFINITNDPFAQAIEDIDVTRIRKCAICFKFFWAGRITQQGCSVACAHALRNRRYRAKYKDYLVNQVLKQKVITETKKPLRKKKGQ